MLISIAVHVFGNLGLEKAERNVLPTLNNLLENREMKLDDGRFLMKAERYMDVGCAAFFARRV